MIITLLIFSLISNAVSLRRDKSILFSRVVITSLLFASFIAFNNLYFKPLEKGIGIYGGLFNVSLFTQTFAIFIFIAGSVVLISTAFRPGIISIKEILSLFALSLKTLFTKEFLCSIPSTILLFFIGEVLYIFESLSSKIEICFGKVLAYLSIFRHEIRHVFKNEAMFLITFSLIIRSLMLVVHYPVTACGFNVTNIKFVCFMFILLVLLYKLIVCHDKIKFILNLIIKLLMLSLFWFVTCYILDITWNAEGFFSLSNFLSYYALESDQFNGLGISSTLKARLDDIFSNLDLHIGFNGNNGPSFIPLFYDPGTGDSEENDRLETMRMRIRDRISKYYNKDFWVLGSEYFTQLKLQTLIERYNNLHLLKDDLVIQKINKFHYYLDSNYPKHMSWHDYSNSSIINYKYMLDRYYLYLWENDVLTKAKFYCENKVKIESSYLWPSIYKSYEFAYNYWLIRQMEHLNPLYHMADNWHAIDYTKLSVYYPEICRDAIWVKLHLVLFDSFLKGFSSEFKVFNLLAYKELLKEESFELKAHKYNIYMSRLFELHCLKYYEAHKCGNELNMLRVSEWTPSQVDFMIKYSSENDPFATNMWKLNTSTSNNLGLGLSKDFAHSKFNAISFFSNL